MFVLLNDGKDIFGTDIHSLSEGEVNQAIAPLTDFFRVREET
jgi:hypothetical protein